VIGRGAESYGRKKAWPSKNHSIISGQRIKMMEDKEAIRKIHLKRLISGY
jgi:hypothetical protein